LSFYIFLINILTALFIGIFSKQINTRLLGTDNFSNLLQIASREMFQYWRLLIPVNISA